MSLSYNINKTKVVLIGSEYYEHYLPIRPAQNNLSDLQKIFTDKNIIGIDNSQITFLDSGAVDILKGLENLCSTDTETETLIIYFVGHGERDFDKNDFYFITRDSDPKMLDMTAISQARIESVLNKSCIPQKILIIDSCYSGAIAQGADLRDHLDINAISGTYIIASCSANDRSFFKEENRYTNFTQELVSTLHTGINNQKDFLSLNEIFNTVSRRLAGYTPKQSPQRKVLNMEDLIFAKNNYCYGRPNPESIRFYEKDIIDYFQSKDDHFSIDSHLPIQWPQVVHWKGEGENKIGEDLIGKKRDDDANVLVAALSGYHEGNTCMLSRKLTLPEAGPRAKLFYPNPDKKSSLKVGIIVSGGIAPGINAVIDGITHRHKLYSTIHNYDIEIVGYRNGFYSFENLLEATNNTILYKKVNDRVSCEIDTAEFANEGGSFLGTSRYDLIIGNDVEAMDQVVENIYQNSIDILYIIGGDGSMRASNAIWEHAQLDKFSRRWNYKLSVIGVPKTMDNDILWVWQTFGFLSAVEKAREIIEQISVEIKSNPRICIVQLFGSDSGFVVSHAVLASKTGTCDIALIPEYKYNLRDLAGSLINRFISKRHESDVPRALIVMAETAIPDDAADFFDCASLTKPERDAIDDYLNSEGFTNQVHKRDDNLRSAGLKVVRYGLEKLFDEYRKNNQDQLNWSRLRFFTNEPRHILRAIRPSCSDIIFAQRLGTLAVDNALAGYTNFMISQWLTEYVLVPLPLVILGKKRIPTTGVFWKSVLAKTRQLQEQELPI